VLALAEQVNGLLSAAGIRTKVDLRDDQTPGFKFNDWEMRGVPVRVEIGPRDVQQNAVVLARRDQPGKEGKQFGVPVEGVATRVKELLGEIQAGLLAQATAYREANTHWVSSYDEFKTVIDNPGGFIKVYWAGSRADEDRIQEETRATLRCLPFETTGEEGRCFLTGERTSQVAIFARAY
jgi:prolyl-tRNA synthetase